MQEYSGGSTQATSGDTVEEKTGGDEPTIEEKD